MNAFYLSSGLTIQSTKEARFTSNFRSGVGTNLVFGFENKKEARIQQLEFLFDFAPQGKSNITYSSNLRPALIYTYLRKSKANIYIGAYADIGTLLDLKNGQWSGNNFISYTIWSSLGVATQYNKKIQINNKSITWKSSFSLPLLTYLIRPSYVYPYSENFITEEYFNFDREGLAQRIITAGKLKTIGAFTNINIQTGLDIPIANDKWSLGIYYKFNYLQAKDTKSLYQFTNHINLIIKKIKIKDAN